MLVDRENKEIFVYGPIGGSFWDDGITAELMVQALASVGQDQRVTVRINSPGGVVDEGIAIYNALKRHKGGVDTVVDAIAASAASVIALAGEKRTTAKGARWMIHRALIIAIGNRSEMLKTAEILQKYDESLIDIYGEYMPLEKSEIESLIDAETWYTASEAIEAGLSTVEDDDAEDVEPIVGAWFRNMPQSINSVQTIAMPKVPVNRQAAEIRNRTRRGLTFK